MQPVADHGSWASRSRDVRMVGEGRPSPGGIGLLFLECIDILDQHLAGVLDEVGLVRFQNILLPVLAPDKFLLTKNVGDDRKQGDIVYVTVIDPQRKQAQGIFLRTRFRPDRLADVFSDIQFDTYSFAELISCHSRVALPSLTLGEWWESYSPFGSSRFLSRAITVSAQTIKEAWAMAGLLACILDAGAWVAGFLG